MGVRIQASHRKAMKLAIGLVLWHIGLIPWFIRFIRPDLRTGSSRKKPAATISDRQELARQACRMAGQARRLRFPCWRNVKRRARFDAPQARAWTGPRRAHWIASSPTARQPLGRRCECRNALAARGLMVNPLLGVAQPVAVCVLPSARNRFFSALRALRALRAARRILRS